MNDHEDLRDMLLLSHIEHIIHTYKNYSTTDGPTHATIIAKLLALVEATKHPYILLGDWQNKAGSFTSTVLPSKFHFDIKAPDHSILSGNVGSRH